jgi:6-phosphogluconolactonase
MVTNKYSLYYLMSALAFLSLTGCGEKTRLVAGCFSETGEKGLVVYNFDTEKGTLNEFSKSNAGANPSYFCFSEKQKLIYSINEVSTFRDVKGGGLTTLKYSENFENIEKVNEMPVPNGGPCFISVTPDEKYLFVANYGGGSVAVVKLDAQGIPERITDTVIFSGSGEKVSHAHMIASDLRGDRIYVTDLGLDRIMIYSLEETSGRLIPFSNDGILLPEGTGPRHFVFNSTGSRMYVVGELNSTISVFQTDKNQGLIPLQIVSSLREGFTGKNSAADIHIGKSGEFLYCTNRGENTIATFKIVPEGQLSRVDNVDCGGNWPRNFVIDPSGKYILAGNQKSDNIAVFRIDRTTGLPSKTDLSFNLPTPACLKFYKN